MPILKKLKVSQHVRDDGPETHFKKEGTPSMGGIIFLVSMAIVGIYAMLKYPSSRLTLFVLLGSTLLFAFV
jgi:phospho-N-acetylmuramoyl-pentapeptide-transferase